MAVTKQTLQLGRVVTAAYYSPSGVTPTPSPGAARLTLRLCAADDAPDLPLLDHLVVGDEHRYFSFREPGLMRAAPPGQLTVVACEYMLITQHMTRHAQGIEDTACAAGVARRASRALTRLYDHHLAQAGLTTTQFSILRTLQRNGGSMSLADLAADLIFERTSLYRALSPLRRSGLVTMRLAADRRAHRVALTKRARRRINQALTHWAAAQRIVLDRFGAAAWSKLALRLGDITTIARWGLPR